MQTMQTEDRELQREIDTLGKMLRVIDSVCSHEQLQVATRYALLAEKAMPILSAPGYHLDWHTDQAGAPAPKSRLTIGQLSTILLALKTVQLRALDAVETDGGRN